MRFSLRTWTCGSWWLALLATGTAPIGAAHAQAPYLLASNPPQNAVSAPVAATVNLTFSQAMNAATAPAIQLHSARLGGVKAAAYAGAGATLSVNPTIDFLPGETVRVTVPAGVRSAGGAAAQPLVYQFTTATGGAGRGNFIAVPANPDVTIPYGADALALGDLDGDGDLDVLVRHGLSAANPANSLSLLVNSGVNSGTFVPGINPTLAGSSFGNIVLGDVDGDGDLDLLATNFIGGNSNNTIPPRNVVNLRLNNGTGVFASPLANADVTIPAASRFLATGDLDGDGDLDLLTIGNSTTNSMGAAVTILLNQGLHSGNFVLPAANATVEIPNASTVVLGDVDGDGDLDFVAGGNNEAYLYLNTGAGSFAAPTTNNVIPVSAGNGISGMALGDVDGDLDLDLLTLKFGVRNGRAVGLVNVLGNDGSNSGRFGVGALNAEVVTADAPRNLVLSDVDGDGDLDLVTANEGYSPPATSFSVRLNDGSGRFAAPSTNADPSVGGYPRWIELGDVDGDGDLDAVTVNGVLGSTSSNSVSVRRNEALPLGTAAARIAPHLGLYPNPAHASFVVEVPAIAGAAEATLTVLDALGRTVHTQQVALRSTATVASVSLPGLTAGLYQVRVQAGGQQLSRHLAVE